MAFALLQVCVCLCFSNQVFKLFTAFCPDGVRYNGISAKYLITCDGAEAINNPFFSKLPHALNKGEALLISAPELPATHIYKRGITIVPWDEPGLFWVGSTYQHNFADTDPTAEFLQNTTRALDNLLKIPYEIKDHWAAVRPSTIERRPFVGIHPKYPQLVILNGMGTKGCSLAPYFAHELTRLLLYSEPLNKAADINRFHQILMST